jgi:hypothetical protein
VASDCAAALSRALAAVARKAGTSEEEATDQLRARARAVWSRFRFELAREIIPIFKQAFPQVRSAYLWDLEEAEPDAAESPASANLDLVLQLEANPAGFDDLVNGIERELSRGFAERVPDTPLALTVHPVTPAMRATGKGVAVLFRSLNTPLVLVSGEE